MKSRRLFLSLFFIAVGLLGEALAAAEPTTARLVTDYTQAPAGATIQAGVLFTIEPGWHIYWKDPGDSGLPTKVIFRGSPELQSVSPLFWPQHETFYQAGDIRGNGYSTEVLLWSTIHLTTSVTDKQEILARVHWLNCSDSVCIPEKRELAASVSIGELKPSPDSTIFGTWKGRLPKE